MRLATAFMMGVIAVCPAAGPGSFSRGTRSLEPVFEQ